MSNTPPVASNQTNTQSFLRKWGSLVVLALALAIIIIDSTILNVSLTTIIKDLHTDGQSIQWVITIYSLMLAALTITGGRLGDMFGRKKMFLTGAILFAIGSAIASVSNSVGMLMVGESVVEGIGAALMMPATASLLLTSFQGRDRAVAFGVWGGIAGAAAALGPIVGGYLTTNFGWHWAFRINIFVVAALLAGSFLVHESRDQEHKPTLDIIGVILSSCSLLLIVFGFIESSTYGWWLAKKDLILNGFTIFASPISFVPFSILLGMLLLGAFLLWERQAERSGKTPLVNLSMFKNRQFASGVLTTATLSLGQMGLMFVLPTFWQTVKGFTPLQTGLAGLPLSISVIIVSPLASILGHRIAPKRLIQLGMVANILSLFLLREALSVNATPWTLAPALSLFGIGMGLVMSQISNLTLSAVDISLAGEASGINNTMRQVGASLGSAIIVSLLLTAFSNNLVNGIQSSTIIPTQAKVQISQAVSSQSSSVEFGGQAAIQAQVPQIVSQEITAITHQANVDASKNSLLYTALFSALGLLTTLLLPKNALKEKPATAVGGH
jgi:EmrB/QacA subfamily drug resistance transporter